MYIATRGLPLLLAIGALVCEPLGAHAGHQPPPAANGAATAGANHNQEAIDVCKNISVHNRYFNYKTYKNCIDGATELLKKMNKVQIAEMTLNIGLFGSETMLYAAELFHAKQWQGPGVKAICEIIRHVHNFDVNDRKKQLSNIVEYGDYAWWSKLLVDAEFTKAFLLQAVIEYILDNPNFKSYIDSYHKYVGENKEGRCNEAKAMDVFTFLSNFEGNPNDKTGKQKRGVTAADYEHLFKAVCPADTKWNDENLPMLFTQKNFLDTDIRNVKLYVTHVPKEMPGLQLHGNVGGYTINDVVFLAETCNGEEACFVVVLKSLIYTVEMGMTPQRVKKIFEQFKPKEVPKSGAEVCTILEHMHRILNELQKPKYFEGQDCEGIVDVVYNTYDYLKVVKNWENTDKNIKRVFSRAVEKKWPVDNINVGWKALKTVADLFGFAE